MAGHNKWANIKHRKGAQDKRKGILFSKCSKAIMAAVRQGGPNPDMNLTLVYAIEKARAANMPRDRIERAIEAAAGVGQGDSWERVVYEGYAPGGVAVLVEALTDNRHRTAPDMKRIFSDHGGNLGASGAVAHMFTASAIFRIDKALANEEKLFGIAVEAGGEDVLLDGNEFEITGPQASFAALRNALAAAGIVVASARLAALPVLKVEVTDAALARRILDMLEELEDNEDVDNVVTNLEMSDALAEELARE